MGTPLYESDINGNWDSGEERPVNYKEERPFPALRDKACISASNTQILITYVESSVILSPPSYICSINVSIIAGKL